MTYYIIYTILLIAGAFCAYKMARADLRRRIIPDVYLFPFMLIGLVLACYFPWVATPGESAAAAAFGYAAGAVLGFLFERARKGKDSDFAPIGLGDVKLLAAGGVWLGPTGLALALIVSCAVGGIWGLRKRQRYIPFAPFFFIGAIIALIALRFLI
jgi:leader peptidase (prepilin peptidase)/N-methyltransferase